MKRILLTTLLLTGLISLSYSQNPTDSQAFQYYKFLAKQQVETALKLNKLGNYLWEYSEMAERCDSFKINRERFDTLAGLFYESATKVNKALLAIIDLREVDSSIGLKDPVIFLFRGYSKMLSDYLPVFLSLLEDGKKNYTPEQILTLKNMNKRYNLLMKDLDSHAEVLDAASTAFMNKYNFTEYDVFKNGL